MVMPPEDVDTRFEELLQDLPAQVLEMAREFKAFCRARKVKTPQQLLRVVMLYCGLDYSQRETAAVFTLLYEPITDTSIGERLAACRPWIKAVLQAMLDRDGLAGVPAGWRLVVVDGTSIEGPGARGTDYRVHLCLDLLTLDVVQLKVTDKRTAESLRLFPLGARDVVLGDRGYCDPNALIDVAQGGSQFLVRLNTGAVTLYTVTGEPIHLMKHLRGHPRQQAQSWPVVIQSRAGQKLTVWLHGYRLSATAAAAARRRVHQRATRNGSTPKKQTLVVAGWVLILTTLPPEVLSGDLVLQLYQTRWPVELAIKRFKSLWLNS